MGRRLGDRDKSRGGSLNVCEGGLWMWEWGKGRNVEERQIWKRGIGKCVNKCRGWDGL